MKRWIAFVLLLTWGCACVGQCVVRGVVSDSSTGKPLEFVNVAFENQPKGTATDATGHFRLMVEEGKKVVLCFSHTGYKKQCLSVVASRSEVQLDVALSPSAQRLNAVEVSGEKTRGSGFTGIEVERIKAADGPGGGVEDIVKTLPDVNSSNELSSQFSVRGGSFDENLVYINGVEVFRPMLTRSGQQEGMSIINPDLVSFVQFSPGGFDVSFGDKMSSVLDITYHAPSERKLSLSASLLGASAALWAPLTDRLSLAASLRHHSNTYLLRKMDTEGAFTSAYTDLQALLNYRCSERLDLGLLLVGSANRYGLVPESQTTAFSQRSMELDVFFDGAEDDRYNTMLGAFTFDYRPSLQWHLRGNLALQRIDESEAYHVQSQYWLYELGLGEGDGEVERFDRGVGTYLEHSRGRLQTSIVSANMAATREATLGRWQLGVRMQHEAAADHRRHWRWVDSAGFALPTQWLVAGDSTNVPVAPLLQDYANSSGGVSSARAVVFAQRELEFVLDDGSTLGLQAGVRNGIYRARLEWFDSSATTPVHAYIDPRLSATYRPDWNADLLFRLSAGGYSQPPLYREYRRADGILNARVKPQRSWQLSATTDWNLHLWGQPLRLTGDIYGKYVSHLVPYVMDNLSMIYSPDDTARAYATGLCLRANANLVDSLESWVSLHLMRSRQEVQGDGVGWYPRPTDQWVSLKLFLQDYVPRIPWWKMSLTLVYATGAPVASNYAPVVQPLRFPNYFRIDWGNAVQLSRFGEIGKWLKNHRVDDVQLSLQVFNLFDRRNVSSYLWVTDYDNRPYRVPNYLTARQLNVRLTVVF